MRSAVAVLVLLFVIGTFPLFAQSSNTTAGATLRIQVTVAPVIQSNPPAARALAVNSDFSIGMDSQPIEIRQVVTDLPATPRAVLETTVVLPL